MDIDLETCILAFLIGFALYLLVNRVFTEGFEEIYNHETGEGINPECLDISVSGNCDPNEKLISCMDTKLGEAGQKRGVPSCGINRARCKFLPNHVWCGNDWGKNPGQPPGQSPSPSPTPTPLPPLDSNDTDNFRNYLKYQEVVNDELDKTFTVMSIYWATMKNDSNNNLYSRIRCPLARGEDVRFTEPSIKKGVEYLMIDAKLLTHVEEDIDLTLSFMIELLKFFNPITLKFLYLRGPASGITGDISVLGNMSGVFPKLTYLNLFQNGITGNISVLGDMGGVFPQLEELYLGLNGITGNISVLGNMKGVFPRLRKLYLNSGVSITGDISVLGNMDGVFPQLEELDLSYNKGITGNISVLGNMGGDSPVFPQLTELDLSETRITGDISVLSNMDDVFPQLTVLDLSGTRITGSINQSIEDIFPNIKSVNPSGLIFTNIPNYCLAPSPTPSSTPSPQ